MWSVVTQRLQLLGRTRSETNAMLMHYLIAVIGDRLLMAEPSEISNRRLWQL
jgi:hypothetical protein